MKWGHQLMNRKNKGSIPRQGLNTCESGNKEKTQQLTGGKEGKATKATIEMERGNGAEELKGRNIGELKDTEGGVTIVKESRNGGREFQDLVGEDDSGETSEKVELGGAMQGILRRTGKQTVAPPRRQELWNRMYGGSGDLKSTRGLDGSDGKLGHVGLAVRSDREIIRTQDTEAVTGADKGWGTPLFDLQPDLGSATSGVLKETYEGRTLYSMGSGSRIGKFWLWRMAREGRVLEEKEVGTPKPGDEEKAEDLLATLGKGGRLNILRDIAKGKGTTLRVSGGSRMKYICTGSIDGETLDLNEFTGVLKIGLRRVRGEDLMTKNVSSGKAGNEVVNYNNAEPGILVKPGTRGTLSIPRTPDPEGTLRDSTGRLITQEDAEEEREIAASGWSLTPITQMVAAGRQPNKLSVGQGAGCAKETMIADRPLKGMKGPPLFRDSPSVKEISARCAAWKGGTYPPPGVNEAFGNIRSRLVIKESRIAGRGTFAGKGGILKHEALGFYEGILTKPEGAYTMTLFKGPDAIHVNADPAVIGYESLLGTINEDLYGGVPNCEVYPDGMFRSLRECNEGEELTIRYWDDYNWDELKNNALQGLLGLISSKVPEMWGWIQRRGLILKVVRTTSHNGSIN